MNTFSTRRLSNARASQNSRFRPTLQFWSREGTLVRRVLIVLCGVLLTLPRWWPGAAGADDLPPRPPREPLARFITLESPIQDEVIGFVRQTAYELLAQAKREDRRSYLILQIPPGTTQFHHVYALAEFLVSPELAEMVTVAWVPETVTGNNALIALACREVLMHPEASLGDLGRGQALSDSERRIALQLVERARNLRINTALAEAMLDPAVGLMQVNVQTEEGIVEKRLLTSDQARELLNSGAIVVDSRILKEPGRPGIFSAAQARSHDFLIGGTASTRREIADAFELPGESLREAAPPTQRGHQVSLIDVRGNIDSVMEEFLKRQISRAIASETNVLIFEIDSQGGGLHEVHDLTITIARLKDDKVRTIAWIPRQAIGEAALVALACEEIYLAPGAVLGDIRSGDPVESNEESVRFVRKALVYLAEHTERPLAVLRALAESELLIFEVSHKTKGTVSYMTDEELHHGDNEWVRGPIVPESGVGRLRLDSALGRQLMIVDAELRDLAALQERLGLPLDMAPIRLQKTWVDDLVFTLNSPFAVGMMFFIGIICVWLELHFMTGVLGLVAAICFALFFWSKVMGGTAGQLEVLLFLIGLVCIALEIFVIPGFGVFGVVGALLVIASLVMASQTFGNLEPNRDLYTVGRTFATFGASVVAVIVMAAALSRFLPRIPFLSELILTPPGVSEMQSPDEPRLRKELVTQPSEMVGRVGNSLSMLRPSGKAIIDGNIVDVFSEGPLIPEGAPIEVVQVTGNKIVVRQSSTT